MKIIFPTIRTRKFQDRLSTERERSELEDEGEGNQTAFQSAAWNVSEWNYKVQLCRIQELSDPGLPVLYNSASLCTVANRSMRQQKVTVYTLPSLSQWSHFPSISTHLHRCHLKNSSKRSGTKPPLHFPTKFHILETYMEYKNLWEHLKYHQSHN